ncbi:MAG: TonB family protein [Rhodocyclaceae bacterium]|nr:TonB family protein [Rhodocyclaceae bacterium]
MARTPRLQNRNRPPTPAASASLDFLRGGSPVLPFALGLSFLLHAIPLTIQFRFPDIEKSFKRDSGLEVVLVNARHARAPDTPEALAQANLDGGGNTDARQTASTPLPPRETRKDGEQLLEAKRRVSPAESAQQKLLTQARQAPAPVAVATRNDIPTEAPRPLSGTELADSSAAIARLEARVDKQLNEYARRPRKKFIGARTQEYRFAQYVEDWRQKIERVGTLNYPDSARGKLYGSLLMSVVIRADGSVKSINIHRSSGHTVLDQAAERIVRLSAPFSAFPGNIRRDTDELEITRTWTFTNADAVRTD